MVICHPLICRCSCLVVVVCLWWSYKYIWNKFADDITHLNDLDITLLCAGDWRCSLLFVVGRHITHAMSFAATTYHVHMSTHFFTAHKHTHSHTLLNSPLMCAHTKTTLDTLTQLPIYCCYTRPCGFGTARNVTTLLSRTPCNIYVYIYLY